LGAKIIMMVGYAGAFAGITLLLRAFFYDHHCPELRADPVVSMSLLLEWRF